MTLQSSFSINSEYRDVEIDEILIKKIKIIADIFQILKKFIKFFFLNDI